MARRVVRGLLIASCILALLMATLWIYVEETPDPLTACYGSKEYDIDRLEITPFSQGQLNDPVRVIEDPTIIERYKKAYGWKNSNAICCDEDTIYIFTEYNDGQVVWKESYKSLLFSQYHNIGFRWQQFCLIHQIEPLYLWGGLICIGLVMVLFHIRKHKRKTIPENGGKNMAKRARFLKELRTDTGLVLWWITFVLSGMLSCIMFFLFIAFVSEKPGMTTWDFDPFILDAQTGVCCVIMFAVTTILAILRYPQMKRTAQAGVAATGFIVVLSAIVSYCVIYLPSPYINQVDYNEPTKDPYVFFALIMGAVVPWAVCLVFYSAIRRIREKRAQKMTEGRG